MTKKFTSLIVLSLIACFSVAKAENELKAVFTAAETEKTVYKQGFDSPENLADWTLTSTNSASTWKLGNPRSSSLPKFSTIDAESLYSLSINYDSKTSQNEEYASPVFNDIAKGAKCKFYAAFDGVFSLYAPLLVIVEDQSDKSRTTIFNSFLWSQDSGHEKPKWLNFEFDLSTFVGKNVRFIFSYKGIDGDDVLIDDFRIVESDNSADAKVTISQGESVNYQDMSTGNPTSWAWTFEGGEPASSTEQNPTVKYNTTGAFNVSLTVSDGTNNESITRTDFVTVQGLAPIAAFDFPEEGYLSTDAGIFIPTNTSVTFLDKSANFPNEWLWTLPGTENTTYTTQNATVTYSNKGEYGAKLTVKNNQGNDMIDYIAPAVKVGGSAHIWNIGMKESENIDAIDMSWYGYYGGTNWLDMYAFAEYYKKPIVKGEISEVDIYFAYTETIDGAVDITVTLRNEKDGLPGDILATSVLSTDKLVNNPTTWAPTTFKFDTPIEVEEAFFIVVDGIPNREDAQYNADKVAMAAIRRDNNAKAESTVYHYGPEYGNEEAGNVWLKNVDDNVSFAIAPLFTYLDKPNSIVSSKNKETAPTVYAKEANIHIKDIDGSYSVKVYNIAGALVGSLQNQLGETTINMSDVHGIHIVRIEKTSSVWSTKVNLQ